MNLKYLEKPSVLIDAAFSRGRKAAANYKDQKTSFYTIKGKEIARIDASYEYIESVLSKTVKEFPSIDKLPLFYHDLFEIIIDINEIRKALSSMTSVLRLMKNIRREQIIKLKELKFEKNAVKTAKDFSKVYFGRTTSMLNGLSKQIEVYNDAIKKLRELPAIKTEEETYFLAGMPNAGKSTLLSKVTSSKPKVAAYPFTTKGLNVGHFFRKYFPVQIIDTPGLLDRPLNKRNKIELRAITAFQHLKGTIIFVVDPMENIKEQKNLFDELRKLFTNQGFFVVINKTDISSEEQISEAKNTFKDFFVLLEGKDTNNLKEELLKIK